MTSLLDAALCLASRGGRIFPIYGLRRAPGGGLTCACGRANCASPGKHPIARLAPKGLINAASDATAIRRWWKAEPAANIGLCTGRAVVLDVDPRHGGDVSLRELEAKHGPLPHTIRALTGGGGEHVYLRPPATVTIRNSAGLLGPGLDVRGVGGYVVAPPSLHKSGRRYAWSTDHHPDETRLAEMPGWLAAALTGPTAAKAPRAAAERGALLGDVIAEGGRNDTLTRITGHLLRRYVDPQLALDLVQAVNLMRCAPPLDPGEVARIVDSIAKKELARREARDAA